MCEYSRQKAPDQFGKTKDNMYPQWQQYTSYLKAIQHVMKVLYGEIDPNWVKWKEKRRSRKNIQPNLSSQGHFQLRD